MGEPVSIAEIGSFDEAIRWQRDLLAKATTLGRPELLDQFRRNLERYQIGEPCRAPWKVEPVSPGAEPG